ncbi:MAG: asparagine synthase (glutamine-hydrolyzing) [Phycisphaerae bacterium]
MCGIAGIVSSEGVDREALRRMADALRHRGPDDEGFLFKDEIGLAHRRLSIIDLETGHQPISNEDDTVWIIYNGEVYNYRELREELVASGHRFKTHTDTEVILHLYEAMGWECVHRLRGMFAFAIWDQPNRRLFMARDPMGQKPLFFYNNGSTFAFASEVKAILSSGLVQPALDLNGMWHYMSLRYLPDRYSLFKGIEKLPAGSRAVLQNGELTVERYWDLDFTNKQANNEDDVVEGLHSILLETTRSHLVSDVLVGAFLSGGIDSSTVAAVMASSGNGTIPVFSIGVKERRFNELPYARLVAAKFQMEHHEKVVQADLIHLIPDMVHHMDEPSDPFGVGVYIVSQLASESVKVVLGGDGGDENFAGYDRYAGNRLVDYYCLLPGWFRSRIMARIVNLIPHSFGYKSLAQKAEWLNEMSQYEGGERYARSASFLRFTPEAKEQLFTRSARNRIDDPDSVGKIMSLFSADNASELVDKMLYTDLMTRMPDHLLTIVDRMSMAHSLEVRSPLVDHKLVEYAASIPADLKLRGRQLKYVLKQVASRYLPREVIHRAKQGFGFPLAFWMRNELSTFLRNLFAQSRFVELGIFDRGVMKNLLEAHLSGKADHNFRLWVLMNLEIWYRLCIERESVDSIREFIDRLMTDGADR